MHDVIGIGTVLLLIPLSLLMFYQSILAAASFFDRAPVIDNARCVHPRFLVLIPAHNEETGIASTLSSLVAVKYPSQHFRVLVVADRCSDSTAEVSRALGALCLERHTGEAGKGAALAWGLQQAKIRGLVFDAVVIIDADTLAHPAVLSAFSAGLQAGHRVQQGYNYISNPWASTFTRIMAVTGVLRNGRYYAGKNVLRLPGMLTGTGMCLAAPVLDRFGWSAFSVGEDWEFSVELLLAGETIYFNSTAKTFAQESQNLKQASRQRLRWASGRYAVMGKKVLKLVGTGLRSGRLTLVDAAVTLVAPNYSSQATLAILCVFGAWTNIDNLTWSHTFVWACGLLSAVAAYFAMGIMSTESPMRALTGLLLVPVFLPWRFAIELLGMLGYGRQHWGRMSRAAMPSNETNR